MKRIVISSVILLIITASAFAQEEQKSAKDRLTEIEKMADSIKESKRSGSSDELFSVDALSHLYIGDHIVAEEKFPGGKSHEVELNLIQFKFEPAKWLSFTAGMDLKWDRFIAKGKMYEIDANGQYALSANPAPDRIKSKICAFGVSAPAAISFNFGKVGLKFGSDATYDFDRYSKIKNKYRNNKGKRQTDILNGGQIENFRLSYFGALLYDDLGLYIRYCPGTVVPGSALVYDLVSVGVFLEM